MEIKMSIITDTNNTYPSDDLIISSDGNHVYLRNSDEKREISVNIFELRKVLDMLSK